MTKLTWDNAAYISIETARKLKVENCDLVEISVAGRTIKVAPVWIAPGQAEDTVSLDLGYGREGIGAVANGAGVDAYALQAAGNRWFVSGAEVAKFGGRRMVYSTQDHGSLRPRRRPGLAPSDGEPQVAVGPQHPPRLRRARPRRAQQWGMVIDLNSCTGCTACTSPARPRTTSRWSAQGGRQRPRDALDPHRPLLHRPEGGPGGGRPADAVSALRDGPLRERLPGRRRPRTAPRASTTWPTTAASAPATAPTTARTRSVASTSSTYNKEPANDHELVRMVKNPDVTVRFRGVIEKCSYCVQRIQEAKIQAHTAGEDLVKDGAIVTACQQVCPSQAITFGDIADPDSKVSKAKASIRNYGVLTDLNTRPRTTYLARVRNPNPELA
jgi:Fe-S-cluster-containing dehydrogenase component